MMASLLTILSAVIILQVSLSVAQGQNKATTTVKIKPGSQNVMGELRLTQDGAGVSIKGTITGLRPGLHGFHIHEHGDLSNACKAAGAHFNPYQKKHGDITSSDSERHVGDLGNIEADSSGTANVNIYDKLISLDPNYKSFVGSRSIVVHEGRDDLGQGGNEESMKTGNAGGRAGCGLVDYSSANNLPIIAPLQLTIGCILCAVIMKIR